MNRTGALFGGWCAVVLALGPGIAYAEEGCPENTPETCSDRVDNDGDGYVDCYDPDCRYLQFCQQQGPPPGQPQYQQPPPGYPPPQYPPPQYPPPQYPPQYAQPQYQQPQYAQPMYIPPPRPPSSGVGEIIVGFIFFPLGAILLGTSVILWNNGSFFSSSSSRIDNAIGGTIMDIFGAAFFVVGAIMIPSGFVKAGRYSQWKKQNPNYHAGLFNLGKGVSLTPSVSAKSDSGTLGFKLSF